MKGLGIALIGILAVAGGIAAATMIMKKKLEKENDEDYYDDWDEEWDDGADFDFDEDADITDTADAKDDKTEEMPSVHADEVRRVSEMVEEVNFPDPDENL